MMDTRPMTTKQMRVLELNSDYLGVTLSMLMQNAGREVARVIGQTTPVSGRRVVVLCGPGGNGGDGMVAARHLCESGADVEVYLIGPEEGIRSPDTAMNWRILERLHDIRHGVLKTESAVVSCDAVREADVVVDALLGFGVRSRLREPILTAVRTINEAPGIRYAIDVPTGIDSDTGEVHGDAVRAHHTVTLHAPKVGLLSAEEYVGQLHVVPIGIPPEAARTCGRGDLWLFARPRPARAHKGDFGRILVVGGSNVYSGAPALAGMAALRTGADLVTVLAPDPVVPAIRAYGPELMVHPTGTEVFCEEALATAVSLAQRSDVVALGPGLGLDSATKSAVVEFVRELMEMGRRVVIDADGLKALADSGVRLSPEDSILTPHWGELCVLLGRSAPAPEDTQQRVSAAVEAAGRYQATVLLKGPVDVVAAPSGDYKLNRTGVPAMTVGGTGDVLTGITAALLARGEGAMSAAAAAAFVSGVAGTLAQHELGDHIAPTDCIRMLPSAMRLDRGQ